MADESKLYRCKIRKDGVLDIKFDVTGFGKNFDLAQMWLTSQFAIDAAPKIPFRQGTLRESVWFPYGLIGGYIEWNTPYAHYMHEGIKYVGGPDEKIPTSEKLHYYTEGTGDHWPEKTAEEHALDYINGVQR